MNLQLAKQKAIELMDKHGLIDQKWYFQFNQRKASAGICSYRKHSIELSAPLTALAIEEDVIDTILHEIAHALVGRGHGHDAVWQRKAIEIGCNGKRCYGGDNKESLEIAYQKIAKYKGTCIGGHPHFRNRKPTKRQSCAQCCPRFNEKYLITWSLA